MRLLLFFSCMTLLVMASTAKPRIRLHEYDVPATTSGGADVDFSYLLTVPAGMKPSEHYELEFRWENVQMDRCDQFYECQVQQTRPVEVHPYTPATLGGVQLGTVKLSHPTDLSTVVAGEAVSVAWEYTVPAGLVPGMSQFVSLHLGYKDMDGWFVLVQDFGLFELSSRAAQLQFSHLLDPRESRDSAYILRAHWAHAPETPCALEGAVELEACAGVADEVRVMVKRSSTVHLSAKTAAFDAASRTLTVDWDYGMGLLGIVSSVKLSLGLMAGGNPNNFSPIGVLTEEVSLASKTSQHVLRSDVPDAALTSPTNRALAVRVEVVLENEELDLCTTGAGSYCRIDSVVPVTGYERLAGASLTMTAAKKGAGKRKADTKLAVQSGESLMVHWTMSESLAATSELNGDRVSFMIGHYFEPGMFVELLALDTFDATDARAAADKEGIELRIPIDMATHADYVLRAEWMPASNDVCTLPSDLCTISSEVPLQVTRHEHAAISIVSPQPGAEFNAGNTVQVAFRVGEALLSEGSEGFGPNSLSIEPMLGVMTDDGDADDMLVLMLTQQMTQFNWTESDVQDDGTVRFTVDFELPMYLRSSSKYVLRLLGEDSLGMCHDLSWCHVFADVNIKVKQDAAAVLHVTKPTSGSSVTAGATIQVQGSIGDRLAGSKLVTYLVAPKEFTTLNEDGGKKDKGGGGLGGGAIAGIVIGVLLGIALIAGIVWYLRRRRRIGAGGTSGYSVMDTPLVDASYEQLAGVSGSSWTVHSDDHGNIYYYNFTTDESTWERPPGF